jgi:NTE family protein
MTHRPESSGTHRRAASARRKLPGQIVLVLQGGGALGAYQAGVYEALHEAGIAPHWVIGTSIGAINAALIAGNPMQRRLERLRRFWQLLEKELPAAQPFGTAVHGLMSGLDTVVRGVCGFFTPNPMAWLGAQASLGVEAASYYCTSPLHRTLASLVDFDRLRASEIRLTVGAVNVRTGRMRYFDSRDEHVRVAHIMASGALPPAFPAIRIDGEPYWDGGLYSNTPIEVVLDDNPRRDSVIFAVNVWRPDGEEPQSLWQVLGRYKDIQYASRADSHIARQKQIHHLRHVIRELWQNLPADRRESAAMKQLASWGCGTTMHIVPFLASRLDGEDHTKDIDFSRERLHARWRAGYADTLKIIDREPWAAPVDPIEGIVVHSL